MEGQETQPVETKPELVPLHEASDADVDEAVKNNPVTKEEPAEESESDGEESTEDAEKVESEDSSEVTEGEVQTEPDAQVDAKDEEPQQKSTEELQKENEKLSAQVEQQERFIQQRNTQFGDLRKELVQIKAALQNGLKEKAEVDPLAAMEDKQQIDLINQKLGEIDGQQATMNRVHETQKIVLANIKPSEVPFEELVGTLKADGVSAEWLRTFETNPYAAQATTGDFIIQLHRRVRAESLLRKVVAAYQKLEAEGKQPKVAAKPTKTETVLKNVEKALRTGPSVTAAAGGGASKELYDVDPTKMSDKEIEEALKKYPYKRR